MKRSALGKGISALIPDAPSLRPGTILELPLDQIRPNPLQPRRTFAPEALEELAASIRSHGLLQPVVVSKDGGGYVLIAGERRWRAAALAGLARVPAVVREAATDTDQLALALIENLQRADLTPIEEARAYHHLRVELGLSQEEVSERVGKERSTVANALRLLGLPMPLQALVDGGELSAGHARALLAVADPTRQATLARRCIDEGWSVRVLERQVSPPPRVKKARPVDPEAAEAADRLSTSLGARVDIRRARRGGEIRITFANEAELIRLFRVLERR